MIEKEAIEYLVTSYRPDRDHVDGVLLERNVGEWEHSPLSRPGLTFRTLACGSYEIFDPPGRKPFRHHLQVREGVYT